MSQEPLRLLLLDAQHGWINPLLPMLQANGFALRLCGHLGEACAQLEEDPADLIVVDLASGLGDGPTLVSWLRSHPPALPVLAVGSLLDEAARVQLLESWADDVMPLPLALAEFSARCRALKRRFQLRRDRWQAKQPTTWLRHERLEMLVEEHRVWCCDQPVQLTPREFRLLEHFLRYPGQVFDRDTLLERVWGESSSLELDTKTVDVHIRWLRRKLEVDPDAPVLITTVRGRGYRLG